MPSTTHLPLISVIVPTHNEEAWIEILLNSFLAQTYANYELIVVDDCSKDRTREMVKRFTRVRLFAFDTQQGEARARSKGVELAQGEIIVQTDADASYPNQFLQIVFETFQKHSSVSGIALGQIYPHPKQQSFLADYMRLKRFASVVTKRFEKKEITGVVAIKKDVYKDIDMYDASLPSGTDVDFAKRMQKKGKQIFWQPDLFIEHADPTSLFVYLRRIWKEGVYSIFYRQRWGLWPKPLSFFTLVMRNFCFLFLPFLGFFSFPSDAWVWFFSTLAFFFILEGIIPLFISFEHATIQKLAWSRKQYLQWLFIPCMLFLQIRIGAFAKMYSGLFTFHIRKKISFE